MHTRLIWAVAGVGLCSCTGEIIGARSAQPPVVPAEWSVPPLPVDCGALPAPSVRLLTNAEIERSLTAAFGANGAALPVLPAGPRLDGFTPNAGREVNQLWVDAMEEGSARLAAAVAPDVERGLACGASEAEEPCVRRALSRWGTALYRRPLAAVELDGAWALYSLGRRSDTVTAGLQLALQGFVGAPSFAYRTELGVVAGRARRLSPWEIASQLSFNLTGGPPDSELQELARSGALEDAQVRTAQVDRLLRGGEGRAQLGRFVDEWFDLENVPHLSRDPAAFPAFTPAVKERLLRETNTFVADVFTGDAPTARTLFGADFTWADDTLSGFYGLSDRPGAALTRVSLAGTERRGILAQAAFLSARSHDLETSPILRGVAVRTRALCLEPPPPPPNIVPQIGSPSEPKTTRERYAQHTSNPSCWGCHRIIDPPGFALEGFDAFGLSRTEEHGFPIDTTGTLIEAGDANGAFVGPRDFLERLAQSQQAADCLIEKVLTFQLGRHADAAGDACLVQAARHHGLRSGGNAVEALKAYVASDAFIRRSL